MYLYIVFRNWIRMFRYKTIYVSFMNKSYAQNVFVAFISSEEKISIYMYIYMYIFICICFVNNYFDVIL
jgi:hypothetical protein